MNRRLLLQLGLAALLPREREREYSFLKPAPDIFMSGCFVDVMPEHAHVPIFSFSGEGTLIGTGNIFSGKRAGCGPMFDLFSPTAIMGEPLPPGSCVVINNLTCTSTELRAIVRREARRASVGGRYA
jgi:hypothetical protein